MRCEEFGTRDLPAQARLEAWRAWYGKVFETAPLHPGKGDFVAHNRAWTLGGLAVNHVTAPGLSVVRTPALIRREPVDHWAITLSARSVTHLRRDEQTLAAAPGVPFVVSLGQAMDNRREADDRIQLYLSRDSFHGIAPLLDACCMSPLHPSSGRLLADYMRLLLRNLPSLGDEDASRLAGATRAMIAACLAPSVQRVAEAQPVVNATLMERVRQAVRRHLRSPVLGPDLICREAATSRSQLYRLLEGEGGVGRYVQKLRLSEAFAQLCEEPPSLTIAAVAEALCFADSSSFARAFRREFGISPSDVRDAARAGVPPIPRRPGADEPVGRSFATTLRGPGVVPLVAATGWPDDGA